MEMMLDKIKFEQFFIQVYKIGHKSAETAFNIGNAFGPRTVNEHSAEVVQKFCQVDKSLEG